jgi:purine nucleoside phosphorylase
LNISLITDYDAGLVGEVPPVQHAEVIKVFNDNNVLSFKERVKAKQKRDNDLYESL